MLIFTSCHAISVTTTLFAADSWKVSSKRVTSKMLEIHNYKLFLDKGIVDFDWNSLVHTTKFGSCGFASALYRSNWHILVSHYRPRNLKLKDVPGFPSNRLFSLKFLNRSLITALPWTRKNWLVNNPLRLKISRDCSAFKTNLLSQWLYQLEEGSSRGLRPVFEVCLCQWKKIGNQYQLMPLPDETERVKILLIN